MHHLWYWHVPSPRIVITIVIDTKTKAVFTLIEELCTTFDTDICIQLYIPISKKDLISFHTKTNQGERNQLLFITTYNKTLPRIRNTLNKHWNLLQINKELKGSFKQTSKFVYRRNKNIQDYIGQTTIQNNKALKKKDLQQGKCRPCLTSTRNLCCRHI